VLITTAGYHTLCTISTNDPRPDWDVSVRLILVQFESGSFSSENKRRISKFTVAPNHSVRSYVNTNDSKKGDDRLCEHPQNRKKTGKRESI